MFGLYLHIPFCLQKCPYCDFNSYAGSTFAARDEYVALLCREIAGRLPEAAQGRAIDTIFFGGGTPSLLEPAQIERLLTECRHATWSDHIEITLEANPGTLVHQPEGHVAPALVEASPEKLAGFRRAGINRLSFGVQSLNDDLLKTLGRWHTGNEARAAYRGARAAGFNNVNLDFIYAIPGQTVEQWECTLEQIVDLAPEHVSCYGLTLEEGTPYFEWHRRGRLRTVDEDAEIRMLAATRERLGQAGYEPYEISNYARPGRQCRHNRIYWKNEDYLGAGAGAHSSLNGVRSWNERSPRRYMEQVRERGRAVEGSEALTPRARLGESIMLALRLTEGADLARLSRRYMLDAEALYCDQVSRLSQAGLLIREDATIRLSSTGLLLANEVMSEFLHVG